MHYASLVGMFKLRGLACNILAILLPPSDLFFNQWSYMMVCYHLFRLSLVFRESGRTPKTAF